ncbi:PAS domain-containing protein [Alloacidobacterium dinghuense]|uniref:histidine kinase n=1 Tax=Alloacidobacterium dinghuense TaxID=2763107 RepID=A0A7G8BD66_9BACT|nr:two-component regulator propeller domain-containing protein [Alloacidobacterium dinghuense]QNI30486.1 PAS domain-containing protein [Alloacidobacterium dinghuense]
MTAFAGQVEATMVRGDSTRRVVSFSSALFLRLKNSRTLIAAKLSIFLGIGINLTLQCSSAFALDPHEPIAQLYHTSWNAKEGVSGNVTALAQTTDGYLWVGTTDGLLRFDGVSFERYQPEAGSLTASSVSALMAVPDGGLWVGFTRGGASFIKNGRVRNYSDPDGFPVYTVRCFARDETGSIWVAAVGGFARLEGQHWQQAYSEWNFSDKTAWALLVDRRGTLWVATGSQIVYLPAGEKRFHSAGLRSGKGSVMLEAPDASILFQDDDRGRFLRFRYDEANGFEALPDIGIRVNSAIFDRDGGLWTGNDGLTRLSFPDGLRDHNLEHVTEKFTQTQGLSNSAVETILEDREGNIWVGTGGGLDRFRHRNITWFPLRGGPFSLFVGPDSKVWAGSRGTSFPVVRVEDRTLVANGPTDVYTVYHDPDGTIWYSGNHTLLHLQDGKLEKVAVPDVVEKLRLSVTPPDPIIASSITRDRAGNLWVAFGGSGEFRLTNGIWNFVPILPDHPDWSAGYTITDSLDRIWLLWGDRIASYDHGNIRIFSAKEGLAIGPPDVMAECNQLIWVGGESGLAFLQGGRFHTIQSAEVTGFTSVTGIVVTPNGDVWLNTGSGVVRIPASEIETVIQHPEHRVTFDLFDLVTDLPEPIQRGEVYSPGAIQADDGSIWIATRSGAVRVDPSHIYKNPLPPPVSIRSIVADGKVYSAFSDLKFPPLTNNLRIEYAAPSLSIPERVRFRYKLDEWDKSWHEAGGRREAFFTHLAPGKYLFRVIASNNDGVWNRKGATLAFTVAPAWFQTVWFRGLCAAILLLLLWAGYQLRLKRLHRHFDMALEAQRANERNLHLIINTIPTLAWSARPDGSVDFFNQHYLDYTGITKGNAQDWGWTAAVHPDDLNRLVDYWRSILASGERGEIEARVRRFDAQHRWFLFRANALHDQVGKIIKWYGTITDIDERKQAEEQLQRSEAFLAEGQYLSRVGSFSWCIATEKITWSEQLYRIFEFEKDVPVTIELAFTRIHPEDLPMMQDMVERAREGARSFEYEYRLLMPDHSLKYLQLIAHGTRDREGRLEYIGAVQDITQRRLAEEALSKARSELSQVTRATSLGVMTASIAHEINQPLSGILTNSNTCMRMLAADPPNLEGARETVRRTIRDGNRVSDVITRLRALFGKKAVAFEAVDLSEATQEVIALLLPELQRNGVIVRSDLANNLPAVSGDRVQLQQVILNLFRNASDAMRTVEDRPRQLTIKTELEADNHVCLTVQDAGLGFDHQSAERLFEAFYTTKNDGMGIGLSVSRSIIESHHGRLWAAPNDGPGATFSFSIPCLVESAVAAIRSAGDVARATLEDSQWLRHAHSSQNRNRDGDLSCGM